jgi:hypothetical protein
MSFIPLCTVCLRRSGPERHPRIERMGIVHLQAFKPCPELHVQVASLHPVPSDQDDILLMQAVRQRERGLPERSCGS